MNQRTKWILAVAIAVAAMGYFSFHSNALRLAGRVGRLVGLIRYEVDVTVDGGTVVAYGRPLTRPYRLTFDGTTVAINGLAYLPLPADPSVVPPAVVVTEEVRQKHKLLSRITRRYVELSRILTLADPAAATAAEFEGEPLLTGIEVSDDGTDMVVRFKGGDSEHVLLSSFDKTYPSPAEIVAQRADRITLLRQLLGEGSMVIFGYGYEVLLPPASAIELRQDIAELVAANATAEQAQRAIGARVSSGDVAADIAANLAAWRGQ